MTDRILFIYNPTLCCLQTK